jgi:hypothetical protein
MNILKFTILLVLFCFVVFLFPNMQTAIDGVSAVETLKPLLEAVPFIFVGASFFAFVYLGVIDND